MATSRLEPETRRIYCASVLPEHLAGSKCSRTRDVLDASLKVRCCTVDSTEFKNFFFSLSLLPGTRHGKRQPG